MKYVELQPRLILIQMRFFGVCVRLFLFCFSANISIVLYTEESIIDKALLSQLEQRKKVYKFW